MSSGNGKTVPPQSAILEVYRERLAPERLVMDQGTDQIQKDAAADQAELKASARNTAKKERD